MAKNKIIAANFKMNLDRHEIDAYLDNFKVENENVLIFPTSIYLLSFLDRGFKVGIQNIASYEKGAYTGEVSVSQVKSIGVDYALIGHSERRTLFHDDDKQVNDKVKLALKNDMKIVLCMGESLDERNNNRTNEILEEQIINDLKDVDDISNIVIAYEPIWAIGTGLIPTVNQIESTINFIKETVKKYKNDDIMVLYGGSVNLDNIAEINSISTVDGFLIGGASLDPNKFLKIIEVVEGQ